MMKNFLLFFFVFGLALSLAQAASCDANNKCRGGTCINNLCAALSATGGPCDDSGDCLFGNSCDTERGKCVVPCPGQTNCGTPDNRNCVTITTDSNNCGTCGYKCGANAFCSNGKCLCNTNFGNCDNNYNSNGCETNLLTSYTYCGSCGTGKRCGTNSFCSSGSCACSSFAYGNCDYNYDSNGCETPLYTPTSCGTCGNIKNCGSNTQCSSGSCGCNSMAYGDCDGDLNNNGNGCETNLAISDTFCGSCGAGNNCGGSGGFSSSCIIGSCRCDFPSDYANVDGSYLNGCEVYFGAGIGF